ncbi:MAG TPA: glycosyltransferase [Chloroflexi bacterium]|nr:glycosyltransferase [Chloroflexota bacterium]
MTTSNNCLCEKCFSIIVPVYNGAETLARCLKPLVEQDYPEECYEVIVVDDGSTDRTSEIARSFPVRLIGLETNRGRVVARNTGARAARFDALLFVDSRVIFPTDGLRRLAEIPHLPQVFWVYTRGEGWGWFNRLFSLIRRRYYRPREPLTPEEASRRENFYLTPENFRRAAKGTTAFACPRGLWLVCQPEEQTRHTHDDTLILEKIVQHTPILRRYDLYVTYLQRERLKDAVVHLFGRGPRFASYYLCPGGAFYRIWLAALALVAVCLIGLTLLAFRFGPVSALAATAGVAFFLLMASALYLAERPSDVAIVILILPLVLGAFGMGVLWGKLLLLIGIPVGRPVAR